ncbi:Centromere/kinetochore Zw10-domain-containing protein [Multifurca ochricompacta]|uniref:Centromere/kinetochore Zw10-domain-containing protein n=1 Tax=Multifurca ochricompacta TaxID=376703 RepID=A0AAD4MB05_9AGAM|nr:Centromere/kinetochore Zw10-domain-containing protein [Multifurca ochricompacta]
MAFIVPSHLPRKAQAAPQDISSTILSKISSAKLAASWVTELDKAILESKTRIHELVHADLPRFEQQLASSKAVQERLAALTTNVNELSDAVAHPELGIVPSLLRSLSAHAALAQKTQDIETKYDAMEHLLQCRKEHDSLVNLTNEGRLTEAVEASTRLQKLLDAAPPALTQAEVFSSLKIAFRTVKDRVEEQLTDAYSRSVVLSQRVLTIRPSVQVRDSKTVLDLSTILSSFSAVSLSSHLAVLRRDINAYYIDNLLAQPFLLPLFAKDTSGISSQTLALLSSQCASEDLSARLENLASVLDFLDTHLFTALPSSHVVSFKKTLCKPITTALLHQFLVPFLPSSLAALPPYLRLVAQAISLEEKYIVGILGQDLRDREVKLWTDAVASHYERRRRAQILEDARQVILREEGGVQIRVEVDVSNLPPPLLPTSVLASQSSGSGSDGLGDVSDDAWGLEGEESGDTDDLVSAAEEEDAWGFDDGPTGHEPAEPGTPPEPPLQQGVLIEPESAPVDDSAWGWDDNDEDPNAPAATSPQASSSDNSADWDDDPWGESPNPSPLPSAPASVPKPANRLEKLANKTKTKAPPHTPPLSLDPPPRPARPRSPGPSKIIQPTGTNEATLTSKKKRPPKTVHQAEAYSISRRAKELADTVDAILREGEEFASTTIFDSGASSTRAQGSVILQTAPAVLDLFRALYPSMVFPNDCLYTCGRALSAARLCVDGAKDKLLESANSLGALGKRWFDREMQQDLVEGSLKKAEGFVGTADQDRFDECEEAVMGVLSQVRTVARQWKGVLNKTRYFDALGSLVNFSLTCILDDILALPDITETESHRLSELCRILHALEGLFVEDPEQVHSSTSPAFPPCPFYSLPRLLHEASLADISYLFDEGALIDYETQELVKLVRALFADTPQRANMINKLTAGRAHSP